MEVTEATNIVVATVLFSIQKKYAEMVYDKRKLHEYRRCRMGIPKGSICLLYETTPVRLVTGYFVAGDLIEGPVPIQDLEFDSGVIYEIGKYLDQSPMWSALQIIEPTKFTKPLSLESLNLSSAPQSYCFLAHRVEGY